MSCVRGNRNLCVLSLLLLLAGCPDSNKPPQPGGAASSSPSIPSAKADLFSSFDGFNEALAKRVSDRITGTDKPMEDFRVVPVTGAAYPVGTLLRRSPLIPVTASACLPPHDDPEVMSSPAPTLFPTYTMTRKVAANIGLDEAVFEGIAKAGLSAAQDSNVNLSISETTLNLWTDTGLNAVLSAKSCRQALQPGTTYRLVRGLVKGKREFVFGLNRTGQADVKLSHIANFQAEVSGGGSAMKVSDPQPEVFVMVVSDVAVPSIITERLKVAAPSAAPAPGSGNKVFVQQDSADNPVNGNKIVQSLQAQGLDVASVVERIPTSKMPSSAQVRYFRAEDEAKAEQVLKVLKAQYPEARLVALRLPAPEGQLEVWLPRKS